MKALIEKYRKEITTLRKSDKYLDEEARSILFGKIDTLEDVIADLETLQSKGKTKSVEGSDVLSFLGNSKRQFAKECGCERCLEILSIHKREEYAQSHANKDGWVRVRAEFLFELASKQEWVNRVPRILPDKIRAGETWVWVDKNGHVFECGADFMDAEKHDTYPCKVYRLVNVSGWAKTLTP